LEPDFAAPTVALLQSEVTIRPATADDLPKLEWFGQYWHFRDLFERTYREQLSGRRLMLVAEADNLLVGQVFIQFDSVEPRFADGVQRAYLYSLRVMKPFRRKGLGTQLVEAAEEAILARGLCWATIAVAKNNADALRLYERLGYCVFTDDPGHWSFTDPAGMRHHVSEPSWIMHKQLI
jgi:ribosomal protein S18 acetylase RimI-like enzyme